MTLHHPQHPELTPPAAGAARNSLTVKALLMSAEGEVRLERCGPSWRIPGGEVAPGETLEHTLQRELQGLKLTATDSFLLTILSGPQTLGRDSHGEAVYAVTAVYVIREWQSAAPLDTLQDFPLDRLPPQLSALDRQALGEVRLCWGMD